MHKSTCIKFVALSTQTFSKSEKEEPQSFKEFPATARTGLSFPVPIKLILNKHNSPNKICLLKFTVGLRMFGLFSALICKARAVCWNF